MEYENLLRLQNQELVRGALRSSHVSTKPELAVATGLSTVTVGNIISRMEESGEVLRGDFAKSGGGRRSVLYHYNEGYKHAAALYLQSGDDLLFLVLAVCDLLGNTVFHERVCISSAYAAGNVDGLMDKALQMGFKITTLTVSLPGVEQENGLLSPATYGLEDILCHLRSRYPISVQFENDINSAVYGWFCSGAGENDNMVGLYFPRFAPPGAGIVQSGKIYRGRRSFAGEFAHIPTAVSWDDLDYKNERLTTEMIGNSMLTFCCTHAPDHLVMYGDFWTENLKKSLCDYMEYHLKGSFFCPVVFSNDIDKDLHNGAVYLALNDLFHEIRGY